MNLVKNILINSKIMRIYFSLFFLLGIGFSSVFSQEVTNAAMYNFSSIAVGSSIQVTDPLSVEEFASSVFYKQDRKFRVELFYNRNNHTDKMNGTYWKMDVTVVSNTTPSQTEVLSLEFSSSTGNYSSWADFTCPLGTPNASTMNWNVSTIVMNKWVSGAWQVTTNTADLPINDIHIEAMALNDRLTMIDPTNSSSKISLDQTLSEISWDYVKGAIEYDVEWVFIDDNDLTNFTYNAGVPSGPFDFKQPVRITTFKHHHQLDLVYPKGTIYLRVRPKGYFAKTIAGDKEIYYSGNWSYLSKSGGNAIVPIATDFEGLKNWSYTVAYAENGLSKGSVTYFDGTYREREKLTKMKSTGQVIAEGSVYDSEGREAIQIIPTPIVTGSLAYFNQLHSDGTGGVFDKNDFDLGTSNVLGTNSGAGQYYSSANTFTFDPFRERVPDAEGYPYAQTDYTNDNTGKPRKTAGVGKTHHMGAGHESQFFYVKPTDRDLRELFGSNVGTATHYDKQIAIDPNGQATVTYTDQLGRIIASGLYAGNPTNLLALDNNVTLGTSRSVGADLMNNNIISTDAQGNKKSVVEFFHMNIGTNPITLNYDLTNGSMNNDPLMGSGNCASCFYKLEVWVYDPTGAVVNLNYNSQTDGLPSQLYPNITEKYSAAQINCASPTFVSGLSAISSTVNLSLTGEYRIYKILSVDVNAVNSYLTTTAPTLSGAPNLASILASYQSNAVTLGCDTDCKSFYDQECREQNGILLTKPYNQFTPQEIALYDPCIASKCLSTNIIANALNDINGGSSADGDYCGNMLDIMKSDVSPEGWVFEEDDTWRVTNQLSTWKKTNYYQPNPSILPPVYFNPTTLQELEDNWKSHYADQLVTSHPEYCHYTKCTTLNTLKAYNQTLTNVTTMATAISGGYLNASYVFQSTSDPLYASSTYTSTISLFTSRITNFNGQTGSAAIYNYVIANHTTLVLNPDGTAMPTTPTAAYNDGVWNVMKKLYLGERDDFMEDNYPGCPYYANSNANFIDPNATVSTDQAGGITSGFDGLNINCSAICNTNVAHWMQLIQQNCPTLTSTQVNTISYNLQNYCLTDCGSFSNTEGAIQTSDVTGNSNLVAVQNIITPLGYNLLSIDVDDACTSPSSTTYNNITQVSTTTGKNLALLQTLESDNYTIFINNPTIVSGGYVASFPSNHWNSTNMKVELKDGTTSLAIINIQNIAEISVIDQQIVTGTPNTLKVRMNVLLIDGTSTNYWVTTFNLFTNVATAIAFPVTALSVNNVIYTYCPNQSNPFEVIYDPKQLETDCISDITSEASILGTQAFNNAYASYINALTIGFSNNCFGSALKEKFSISYLKKEYAFTLYYYDQAGNLVQTVPPQGVNIVPAAAFNSDNVWNGTTEPTHTMKTIYTYNSLQQITKKNTPDGGISQVWYNAVQQPRFSQNAQQAVIDGTGKIQYSYIKYDALGRSVEVGLAKNASMSTVIASINDNTYPTASVSAPNTEVVITHYEVQDLAIDAALGWKPENLSTRISALAYYDSYTGTNPLLYNSAIFYDYDINGNVIEMLTDARTLDGTNISNNNIRYKKLNYDINVYSGKVNEVWYQKEKEDQFIHRYKYDDDNRITSVFTSTDGIKWDQDASYYYYLHGPLARTELGETKVQGIDYAYTVHGWLKGVNSNTALASKDLGKDGTIINETGLTSTQKIQRKRNRWMAQDAYGYSLTYFNNQANEVDYKAIDTYVNPWLASNETAFLPTSYANLYNSNIRAVVTAIKKTDNTSLGTVARVYKYDQLQRIKEAQTYTAASLETTNSWTGATTSQAHYSSYQYDLNGNITHLTRNGGNPTNYTLDDLTYSYYASTGYTAIPNVKNQLASVTDNPSIPSTNYTDDIETQVANNYVYDKAGRMTWDASEKISISWTANNQVSYIQHDNTTMKSDFAYKYDPMGMRIASIEYPKSAPGVINYSGAVMTFYGIDGKGNTMATYTQTGMTSTIVTLESYEIYGIDNIGVKNSGVILSTTPNFNYINADNRASAIVELKAANYTVGQGIQFRSGTTVLNTQVAWQSNVNLNAENLIAEVNKMTVTTDVSASIWYSNNASGTVYLQLKYGQAGNWNSKSLGIYINGVLGTSQAQTPKRNFGYGSAKGKFIAGNKRFNIKNHLNNIIEIISDRKWGIDDGQYNQTTGVKTSSTLDGLVDFYIPTIVNYCDYDPFGTEQTNRKGGIRGTHGFQDQLLDDDVKGEGNSVNYKYRMHDPRIGRFFAIDPLAPKYAHNSPYAFSENRVIDCVELEGLEASKTSYGFNGTYWGVSVAVSVSVICGPDGFMFVWTLEGGAGIGAGAGLGLSTAYYPHVGACDELTGWGVTVGGSLPAGLSLDVEISLQQDEKGKVDDWRGGVSRGIPNSGPTFKAGAEAHARVGYTWDLSGTITHKEAKDLISEIASDYYISAKILRKALREARESQHALAAAMKKEERAKARKKKQEIKERNKKKKHFKMQKGKYKF